MGGQREGGYCEAGRKLNRKAKNENKKKDNIFHRPSCRSSDDKRSRTAQCDGVSLRRAGKCLHLH